MTSAIQVFAQLLAPYQKITNEKIPEHLDLLGPKNKLRDACEYALMNGGKRFRPGLVYFIADRIGKGLDVSKAALATEFFHAASLVADDLPSMDDDDERRGKKSTHVVYGESVALLVTYALIAAGYDFITKCATESPLPYSDKLCSLAIANATQNTGLRVATGGQFLDVFPPDLTEETLRTVIRMKTVSLFEISFVFGWLFGGGDLDKLDQVKQAASHFGMAFQIADDIGDMEQDQKNGRKINMANVFGLEAAEKMFHVEHSAFLQTMHGLGIGL